MIKVNSEVGRLRSVLVHEPGPEVDSMIPAMMEELLFDDILFGKSAREEHGKFRRVLQVMGIEVVEAQDLLEQTLKIPSARDWLTTRILATLSEASRKRFENAEPDRLAATFVSGLLGEHPPGRIPEIEDTFQISPLPNWCFQRDPQVLIGSGVVFSAMATSARWREALLGRVIFKFHPRFAGVEVLCDPYENQANHFSDLGGAHFEGGDILVLSKDVLAVGISERTNREGIRVLAKALANREEGPRWLQMVELPKHRAYMHLDTLMTPVDRDACLVFPPVILPGRRRTAKVFEIDLHSADLKATEGKDLLAQLKTRGLDMEPIACGGNDSISQQREQWTDGANALAAAPGVIFLYRRNVGTAEALKQHGFDIVPAEDLLLGRREVNLDDEKRVCIQIESHEIARARGGPHCLTHPILRDDNV